MEDDFESDVICCITFNVFATISAWSTFGMGIAAASSDNWINFDNGTFNVSSGLWTTSTNSAASGFQSRVEITNPAAWLNTTRAFVILMLIFTFFGCMVNAVLYCRPDEKTLKRSGNILLIAAILGVIASSVYTGVAPQDLNAAGIAYFYGSGFILCWISTGVLFLAFLFIQISVFCMPDRDEIACYLLCQCLPAMMGFC